MTAVVEVRSTPLLSRLLKGGWFFVSFGEYISSRIFPKVTREVRSSSDGFCVVVLLVFVLKKKKKNHLCKAPWSSNLGIRCLGPAFSVCFPVTPLAQVAVSAQNPCEERYKCT